MMLRKTLIAAVAALATAWTAGAQDSASESRVPRSATIARDINGFQLGADIEEVRARTAVTHIAGETYSAFADGIEYEFGLTPLGRVFRIRSVQPLGRFHPDAEFANSLAERLTRKYGTPSTNQLPDGPAFWSLVEPIERPDGQTVPFQTMSVSAMLIEAEGQMALELFMLDFRVLWADQQAINAAPSQAAQDRTRF